MWCLWTTVSSNKCMCMYLIQYAFLRASYVVIVVKNLPTSAGDLRDMDSIPGSGRHPREGPGNPLQYSCLENPMDRGAWRATVHGVWKSQAQQKWLSTHRYFSPNSRLTYLHQVVQFSSVQSPSHVWFLVTSRTAAHQAFLAISKWWRVFIPTFETGWDVVDVLISRIRWSDATDFCS